MIKVRANSELPLAPYIPDAPTVYGQCMAKRSLGEDDGYYSMFSRRLIAGLYLDPVVDKRIQELCWRTLYNGENPKDIGWEQQYRPIGPDGVTTLVMYGIDIIGKRQHAIFAGTLEERQERDEIAMVLKNTWKAENRRQAAERAKREAEQEKREARAAAIERNREAKAKAKGESK